MHDVKIVDYANLIMKFIYDILNLVGFGRIDYVKTKIPPLTASFQAMESSK